MLEKKTLSIDYFMLLVAKKSLSFVDVILLLVALFASFTASVLI